MGMHTIADFHFIRPYWLLAVVGLLIALFLLKKMRVKQSGWQGILPKHLANALIEKTHSSKPLSLMLPFFVGLLAITAMAGPSWQKLPQPVYQLTRGAVLIMDMSYSMYATDLSPNRLTRARYKASDLLDNLSEGEIGLIAYAGDAFVISPLTEDINNIKLLLPSLSPDLMPELGSDPMRALALAHNMLMNAGHIDGDIYWFTDGIENSEIQEITQWSREHPYRLNVLGVGTKAGAPIKLTNGEFMKESNGSIVVPKLTENALKGSAKRGNGQYVRLQNNSDDIKTLLNSAEQHANSAEKEQKKSSNTGDQWEEFGPYLLLCLLPFVLGYFRRGKLLAVLPIMFLMTPNQPVYASVWDDLWKTKNQQAQSKFNQQEYKTAAAQFNDPLWQGSSHYKAGNYEEALKAFQKNDNAESLYNQGNTLAKLNKLDEAINAYEKALEQDPNLEDAKANKKLIEDLKQQQEQQNSDKKQNDENQEGDESEQDQNSEEDDQGKQSESDEQQGNSGKNKQSSNNEPSEPSEPSDEENEQEDSQSQNENAEDEQESQQENATEADEQEAAAQEGENDENLTEEQKVQAMRAAEKLAQETDQKYQQLLNKVTDDPYQLLRNKMQLEYKKRHQNRSSLGATKKW